MIRDHLVPALQREFPGCEIVFDTPPNPIATFPANQEAVGKVCVYDDGDEATVCIEKITHGHFNPYNEALTDDERARIVTEEVIDFLKALFSDRILLETSADHRVGGWTRIDVRDKPVELVRSHRYFLWSKPYKLGKWTAVSRWLLGQLHR
jgi:hypothetical protein